MDQNVILVETVPLEFDLESLGCRLRIRPGQTKFMDRLSRLAGDGDLFFVVEAHHGETGSCTVRRVVLPDVGITHRCFLFFGIYFKTTVLFYHDIPAFASRSFQ